jgi:hypothetical protein
MAGASFLILSLFILRLYLLNGLFPKCWLILLFTENVIMVGHLNALTFEKSCPSCYVDAKPL